MTTRTFELSIKILSKAVTRATDSWTGWNWSRTFDSHILEPYGWPPASEEPGRDDDGYSIAVAEGVETQVIDASDWETCESCDMHRDGLAFDETPLEIDIPTDACEHVRACYADAIAYGRGVADAASCAAESGAAAVDSLRDALRSHKKFFQKLSASGGGIRDYGDVLERLEDAETSIAAATGAEQNYGDTPTWGPVRDRMSCLIDMWRNEMDEGKEIA